MANMSDMLRGMAASGMSGAGGSSGAMSGDTATAQGAPPTPDDGGGDPSDDISSTLDQLESSFQDAPPDVGDKARKHILALRDLATKVPKEPDQDDQSQGQDPNAPPSPDGQPTSATDQSAAPQM